MSISHIIISPESDAVNVDLNTEVVFRIIESSGTINLSTLFVGITVGALQEIAIENGIFKNGYGGEFIDNSNGNLTDITVVVIRPSESPNYQQGRKVTIDVDISAYIFSYSFTPKSYEFVFPATYTEELNLNSLPVGFTIQTTGTGTPPTYGPNGMTTVPNTSGSSFIKRNASGLDFEAGVLFDVVVKVPLGSIAAQKRIKVLKLSKGDQGIVSIYVDFTSKEVWLDDIVNILQIDFRPGVKDDDLFFRLSVKGAGENMVARLYSAKESFIDPPLMKQTGGPSILMPISIDSIDLGSIEPGDADVLVSSVKILLNKDPDTYYPFPQISKISPKSDILSGGKTFKVEFVSEIDIDAGSSLLFTDDEFNDESTGAGSINVQTGTLTLASSGIGKAMARMLRSFSGDLPSGADISTRIRVDQDVLLHPPQADIILAGVEIRANGNILAIELVTNIVENAFFKIRAISGNITTLNKKILATQKNDFIVRFIKAENQIRILVDGITLIDTSLKDGPGIVKYYAETTEDISFTTQISDIVIRPVIMIGDSIVNV